MRFEIVILSLIFLAVLAALYLLIKKLPKSHDEKNNKEAEEIANLKSEITNLKDTLNTTIIIH